MLTNKVTDKNSIKLIDSSEQVWCEIVCDDNICTLKLNQNISADYRGESNTDMFKQMISCADSRVEKDVELWIQYSMDNTISLGSLVVDLWYC